jgi:hypothetical protein
MLSLKRTFEDIATAAASPPFRPESASSEILEYVRRANGSTKRHESHKRDSIREALSLTAMRDLDGHDEK